MHGHRSGTEEGRPPPALRRTRPGRSSGLLGLSLGVALVAALPARATVVRALDLGQKANIAKVIVLAKVEKQEARWMVEGGAIKTIVTLRVEESLKGELSAGKTIQVAMPGGQIGDFVHRVSGTSTYEKGERAVLFLEPHPDGWVEIGVGIGKYGIETIGGKPMVTHRPHVTVARASGDDAPSKLEPAKSMAPTPLPEFLATVRASVGVKR